MPTDTPRYGHAPILMKRVAKTEDLDNVGEFAWDDQGDGRHLAVLLPSPTSAAPDNYAYIRIRVAQGGNVSGVHWGWNGDEDKPTLTPSVHAHGHWHGWVRDGMLVEA